MGVLIDPGFCSAELFPHGDLDGQHFDDTAYPSSNPPSWTVILQSQPRAIDRLPKELLERILFYAVQGSQIQVSHASD